jgi:hypothetical protein
MIKKALIFLLVIYVFFADIIISLMHMPVLKTVLALLVVLLFVFYVVLNFSKLEHTRVVYASLFFILISLINWTSFGYLNLYYTIIFGWVLAQDFKLTMSLLLTIFIIQFFLVLYESITTTIIYDSVTSGVINQNDYNTSKSYELFEATGFRPKGLFPGTLVATSFIIYLVMFYRNNVKMLLGLVILALMTNGRLALIVASFTFFYKIFKQYDIVDGNRKIPIVLKLAWILIPFSTIVFGVAFLLPDTVLENLSNSFDFNSSANVGRVYAYGQSILLYIDYDFIQKLFGSPGNVVFDVYDREIASESGLLSMILDIGIVGLAYYLYTFYRMWKGEDNSSFNLRSKFIGVKYVVLVTFVSFIQYEHINGNVRGILFWFFVISQSIMLKKKDTV